MANTDQYRDRLSITTTIIISIIIISLATLPSSYYACRIFSEDAE